MHTKVIGIRILQAAIFSVFALFGLDKYFSILESDWTHYLSPLATQLLHGHDAGFMKIVGACEMIAAIGVIFKPKIFGFILSGWLFLIIINLLMTGHGYDDAVRDIGLCLSAFALGMLSLKSG